MIYKGELLALNDSVLYFNSDGKYYKLKHSDLHNVFVHGYSLRKTKMATLAPPLLIAGYLIIDADFEPNEDPQSRIIIGLSILSTIAAFFIGDPEVDFTVPFEYNDIERLKLFSRYPQGLTQEQWQQVLQHRKQNTFIRPLQD